MCQSLMGAAANCRKPKIQIGPTVKVSEFKARVREIRKLKTRYGPVPLAVARRIAHALCHFENGYHWRGPRRSGGRIALLVLVSDIVRAVEEGMDFPFKVSDGQNASETIRHCRNGQFLRALLNSCQIDKSARRYIPAQLAQLVDASHIISHAQSVEKI